MEGCVRGRAELDAPSYSIVSGDWMTGSYAWPAESVQGYVHVKVSHLLRLCTTT